MLKSIFLLITAVVLFSGCHRYHHNIRTVISPAIIINPFHIRSYHHGYNRGHGHHRSRHYNSRRRGH